MWWWGDNQFLFFLSALVSTKNVPGLVLFLSIDVIIKSPVVSKIKRHTTSQNGVNKVEISTELCKNAKSCKVPDNHPQNVPLRTTKMHYGAIFQPPIPETWQECVYTTL